MQIEIKKENEGRLKELLRTVGNVKLRNARDNYDDTQQYINNYLINLKELYKKLKEYSDVINKETDNQINMAEKLMSVSGLSKVASATYDTDTKKIIVTTHTLFFRTLNGGRYRLGHAAITFDTNNFNISFETDNKRRSYWGNNCSHPHVSHRGEACLGNTGELIASLQAENEFGLIFEVLIAFLEQANTDDCAGRHAMNWDKVDDEGNVIQEGFMDKDGGIFHYGDTPEEDTVKECGVCACCGDAFDGEDDRYQTIDGDYVCEHCKDNEYAYCEECDGLEHTDNMNYINDIGYVCEACTDRHYIYCEVCEEYTHEDDATWIENEQRSVCSHCRDRNYTWCDECEEWCPNDETTYVESADRDVCKECLEENYEKCYECGEYFLRDDMTAVSDGNNTDYYCEECHAVLVENSEDDEENAVDDMLNRIAVTEAPQLITPIDVLGTMEINMDDVIGNDDVPETCVVCGKELNCLNKTEYNGNTYCVECIVNAL